MRPSHLVFLVYAVFAADQRTDLVNLYNSAGGSSWQNGGNANWLNGDPCSNSWAGITCSGGVVTIINLDKFALQGSIPDAFGAGLTQVTELHITLNYQGNTNYGSNFQGLYNTPIPSGLSSMTKMKYLYINSNDFSGNIPDLSGMVNLQQADFEYNRLTGFANPGGLSVLTYLQALKLYRNFFASVPSSFTSMSTCTSIRMECNKLTSTVDPGIWSMPNVKELSFGFQVRGDQYAVYNPTGNRVPGIVPKSISTKTLLDLSGNAFDEFEDYTMGSPLGSGATCDMSSKGSPSGPNFACPIPGWASSICSASCSCYTPTTSSVSGNPPNAGGDIVITGRYWGGTPSVTVDGRTCTYKSSTRTTITCTAPACQNAQNTGSVVVIGDQYAVYNPTGNRVPGIVPKSISTKTLLDLTGNAFDEFEDYTMGSPLGSGATCDMSSKGSPSGPNFACPIPGWASSSCSASCSCYTPTISSVSGNPPNAGGDIVITGRYWGEDVGERLTETQRNAKCDSGWKDMHIQVIDSHDHHVYSPCMSECTEHGKCSCQVGILHLHVECSYDDIPGSHDIIYNVDNIVHYIVYNEADDIDNILNNVDNILNNVDDLLYKVNDFLNNVDNILHIIDNILHIIDNILYDVYYQTDHIYNIDNFFNNPSTSTTSSTKPSTFTTSSTTSSIPSTSSTTTATTTDIPFCDQIFLSFNRSLSSSVLQDQLRGIQPLAMQCPEQLNAVVLQIASTNLQRNKTFVVEAGNISIAAGKIANGTQLHLVFGVSAASGLIPSDVADLLPVNSSAVLSVYTFNPYVTSSSTDTVQFTNVVSLSVTSANGTEVSIHNTSSAIEIGMDYNAVDGYEIECVWWDNSTRGWNREGCTTDTSSQPVKCLCNHLTSFSLQVTPKEVPPSEIAAKPFPWKWVGIGAGGFVFILAVALVLIIVMTRKRKLKKNDDDFDMTTTNSTAPHVIPADQILPEGYLSPRVRKARYQLSNVIVVRAQAGDGLSDQLLQRLKHINIAQYLGCYVDTIGDTYF
ncbi:hypothetical protein PROFUN_13765, partial [Planoprotostelium fungivorum]